MKNEAKNVECRNEEGYAASLVRSCKSAIAYWFEKGDKSHIIDVYFCRTYEKIESKFIDSDEICKMSHL